MSSSMVSADEAAAMGFYADSARLGLGAQFMAVAFDALFCGIIICQVAHWLPQAGHDARHVQIITAFGIIAAFCTTAYCWSTYMTSFVYEFGHYARFASLDTLGWFPTLDVLTVMPVQLLFTERVYKINKNSKPLLALCLLLTAMTGVAAFSVTAVTRGATMMDKTYTAQVLMILWPAICCTTHVVVTASIVGGLLKNRTSDFGQTNKMIDRLIGMSLECQLPATIFAIGITTTIAVSPDSGIIPWIVIVHAKVFLIGCMAMINARHTWRKLGKSFSRPDTANFSGSRSGPMNVPVTTQTTISWSESSGPKTPDESYIHTSSEVQLVDFDQKSALSAAPFSDFASTEKMV